MIKVSDYIADCLYDNGVTCVFEVIGGMITLLIDSIHSRGKIQIVSMHHEQAAAFAVDGASRMAGTPFVALATSGPGAVNLLTGIGSCYFDSTPAVFLTGQVNRHELKGNLPVRQLGFQETDIVSMAEPITKAAWTVQNANDIPQLFKDAFQLATSGRPGPVLIDIPMDVQKEMIDVSTSHTHTKHLSSEIDIPMVQKLFTHLNKAKRPVILAGGGLRSARVVDAFRNLVEKIGLPVLNSLMAVDVLPSSSSYKAGFIGSYGNRWANHALGLSDFVLVLGSRLDIRQTGAETEAFSKDKVIYHVDCDSGETNNRIKGCHVILADLSVFLNEAISQVTTLLLPNFSTWLDEIASMRQNQSDVDEIQEIEGINPNVFMHELSGSSQQASAYVIDVGQHQMWAAQSLDLTADQRFLTSGGMGAMGFSLPAAIGAVYSASEQKPIVVIAGDGGFQLNIQELQTIRRNQLPVKIVLLNNHSHGMVRQFQQSYFEERYQSTVWGYSAPDFVRVAQAYGIGASRIHSPEDVLAGLELLWQHPNEPYLLEVHIDTGANVYPKIAFGHPLTEMEPFVKPLGMEST
jgi:acetolactate synthase I/II/III large subunit